MKKILLLTSLLTVLVFIIIGSNCQFLSKSKLDELKTGFSDFNYVHFGVLYDNGEIKLDLKNLLLEEDKLLQQVYTQIDTTVYFSYQYVKENIVHWCIAKIQNDGNNMLVLCDEIVESNSMNKFEVDLSKDYKNRNGYCYNGTIVLTDFAKLVEYNIKTNKKSVYEYGDYSHPTEVFRYEIKDNQEVMLNYNKQSRVLTIADFIDKSEVAKTIYEKYNHKTINGTYACEYFLDSVQFIDNDIFIVCRIHRWDGCAFAIVFKYDFFADNIDYCGGHYTNDLIRHFYLLA